MVVFMTIRTEWGGGSSLVFLMSSFCFYCLANFGRVSQCELRENDLSS